MKNEQDEHFYEAGLLVIKTGYGSVSVLQRNLAIGYSRAFRILQQLERANVLGEFAHGHYHQVLVDAEAFHAGFEHLAPDAREKVETA